MGHSISHYTSKVTNKKGLDAFLSSITEDAYDPGETDCYHGNLTVHQDKVYKNYDEAMQAIQHYDNGWYDDHVVMYYDISNEGRDKIEEWNKKRDAYIKEHSIHKRTSKFVGCPEYGSKLSLEHLRGEKCPLCNTDLRPQTTIDKIKWFDKKVIECAEKYKEKFWLAKIEYHC